MSKWLEQFSAGGAPSRYQGSPDVESTRNPVAAQQQQPTKRSNMHASMTDEAFRSGNERLYEAYNDLHALAQDFEKPFDAPAILVVGQQTDGKSALVEALMGFQFNHVGGGTKTRRPITLHMIYNASCIEPCCYLVTDDQGEVEVTLEELQDYIESENLRLEQESDKFWAKEIVVKMEYKYCPNLTIIDTPGLISAVNMPGRKTSHLANAAKQVEAMVRSKMEQKEYIILCLEDTSDWSNATTRKLVAQVDPNLSRTVIVSTKFDTRIPQFARGADVECFINPSSRQLEGNMLGGFPFFTSVPAGRVGTGRDSVFRSSEQFRIAVMEREEMDVSEVERKLQRKLETSERSRIGVSQLRRFLEQLLQRRYLENVPSIVPVLEKEHRNASAKMRAVMEELNDLQGDKLREKGRSFRESFLAKLQLILRGTVAAPPERFGETLSDEHIRGGAFVGPDGRPLLVGDALPNAHMRLFGGAQYHRAMAEFRQAVGQLVCPDISREEIVNACGVDDFHDGVNYTRTACVIAVSKARDIFEPFLHQLGYRLAHVLRRMLPIAMHLLQKDNQFLTGHDLFLKRVGAAFHGFIDHVEQDCRKKCLEDLQSSTRYVTWSLHTKSRAGLRAMLSRVSNANDVSTGSGGGGAPSQARPAASSGGNTAAAVVNSGGGPRDVVDMLENTLWNRKLGVMSEEIVAALVCQIFEGIRDFIVQSTELKFNCFFLMPMVDYFPTKLREELEAAYEADLDGVFDVAAVRTLLDQQRKSLGLELEQVERLQRKFTTIHSTLSHPTMMPGVNVSIGSGGVGGNVAAAKRVVVDVSPLQDARQSRRDVLDNLSAMTLKNGDGVGKRIVESSGENALRASQQMLGGRPPLAGMR